VTSDEHQGSLDNKSQSPSSTDPILPQGTHTTKLPWDKTLRPPDINNCTHLPTRSRIFFGLEIQQPGLGMRHIICQAFTGSTDEAHLLTQEEIELHLDIIQQCIANSRKSNASFARIIRNIISSLLFNPSRPAIIPHEYHRRVMLSLSSNHEFNASQLQTISKALSQETNRVIAECRIPYSIFRVTRLPTMYSEIRKYYLEGKDAIIPNLPCPKARMLEDGIHAYISPLELVSHYLAWGQGNQTRLLRDPKQSNSVSCYHHSTHAQTITHHINSTIDANSELSSFPLILFLTDWQDEFDKNNIIRNKYQIFIRTLTILMQGKRGILEKHTFIVALGSKGDSRYALDMAYNEDLKKLSQIHEVYDGLNKKNIHAMAVLVASLEDRIERSGMLFIGQQNQKFCASFGHSTYLDNDTKLPSCTRCFKARVRLLVSNRSRESHASGIPECRDCADWYILCTNGSLNVKTDILEDYPSCLYDGSPEYPTERPVGPLVQWIGPMRLGFPQLRKGSDFAFYNYHYSRRQRGPSIKWTVANLEFYIKSIGLNTQFYKMVRTCSDKYLHLEPADALLRFREEVHPPSWDRPHSGLSAHLEATFHCVFRGLVPDHVEICLASMKKVTSMKPIHSVLNKILASVKQLFLPRVNVSLFGKTDHTKLSMGGWQGSQENALSKLIVHAFVHCRIHAKRISTVGNDLMKRTFDLLEKATYAFYCTISRIMSEEITETLPDETLQYAKLYLSYLTELETISLDKKKSPVWKRTGNHVGLLNIPEVIRRYGPVHTYYEAADETTIQWMKPLVKTVSTSSQSWKVTVMDTLTRQQTLMVAMDNLKKSGFGDAVEEEEEEEIGWIPDDFKITRDLELLTKKFRGGEALTAVCIDGEYCLLPYWGTHALTKKRAVMYRRVREQYSGSTYIGGIRYSCFDKTLYNPSRPALLPITKTQLRKQITHVYLFLPLIPKETGTVSMDKMLVHVCGMKWDVMKITTSNLVHPKWSDK
jgi:hypothetical protein